MKHIKYLVIIVILVLGNQTISAQEESKSAKEKEEYTSEKGKKKMNGVEDKAMDMRKYKAEQRAKLEGLKGKELGEAKVEQVKKKTKLHVTKFEKGEDKVKMGREKIKEAKERLAIAKEGKEGQARLTQEQIAQKEAKIAKAEKQVNDLEESVKKGKQKAKKGKEALDKVYSEKH
ncbi:hypothetical protein [Aquimarina pacifica]|uniref:hypothetical protein n=1 Tax=Aquimarina pacifica TaxID=1296415 RepID=UPI000470EDAA|nr:hypothetical protein [Aquimarina pacifica]